MASDVASGVKDVEKNPKLAIKAAYMRSCMLGFESACTDATRLIKETSSK